MVGTLREHRRRHTGERPYKCKYCEATFINNSSLKTHTAKHTGILPYKCQACGKLFAKSYGLKMHSLSHSNEKPFVCEVIIFCVSLSFIYLFFFFLDSYRRVCCPEDVKLFPLDIGLSV